LKRFFGARGGFGFFCGNVKNVANCLDKKERSESLRTVNESKYYLEISKIGRGPETQKFPNQFPD
jgi:hypothetical protein